MPVITETPWVDTIAEFITASLVTEGVKDEHAARIGKKTAKALVLLLARERNER
jgi:hypothetical protein